MKVVFYQGIPASGKSFSAKKLSEDPKWKRVNRDEIRAMVDNGKFSGKNEKLVTKIQHSMIVEALKAGYNVVDDNTNLNPKTIPAIKKAISDAGITDVLYETKFFDVSVEEAVKRDAKRENSVGHEVIWGFANRYLDRRTNFRNQSADGKRIPLYICDIDGTLAKMHNRSPFEWDKVGNDLCRHDVADVIDQLKISGSMIYLFSGRDSVCREQTEQWLLKHNIEYDGLFMRPEGDSRKDTEIKYNMFIENVYKKGFVVKGVYDDRPCMVRQWRSMGLTVFNVDDRMYPTEF